MRHSFAIYGEFGFSHFEQNFKISSDFSSENIGKICAQFETCKITSKAYTWNKVTILNWNEVTSGWNKVVMERRTM